MPFSSDPLQPFARRIQATVLVAAGACALVSVSALTGWITGVSQLTTFGRAWTPIMANTAIAIGLGALAVMLVAAGEVTRIRWRAVHVFGALIAATALAVLVNFANLSLRGIPLFASGPHWQMAATSAMALTMFGAALVAMGRGGRADRAGEWLVGTSLVLGVVMLLAFVYGATPLSHFMGKVSMSPISALCISVLSGALLMVAPGGWVVHIVSGSGPGSKLARRVLPIALAGPVALGLLRIQLQHRGLIGLEDGIAMMVIVPLMFLTIAILWGAAHVNQSDAVRRHELETQSFLVRASYLLSASLDLNSTLAAVSQLAVPTVADWSTITLANADGSLETVTGAHQDPAKTAWAREYIQRFPPRPDDAAGAALVIRTGKPDFYPDIPDERLVLSIQNDDQLALLRSLGIRSIIRVPLIAGGRTLGALALIMAESGRRYGADDLRLAQQLADRCAVAIEHAQLFSELRMLTAELEHRVARRTAELAVANQELESFAYSVSHDLRTPLRALDGFSQALIEDYAAVLDDAGKDYLDRIRRGSQRMGDLIDSLLDLSRVSRGELRREHVDLSVMAREILESLKEGTPARRVRANVRDGLTATGDPRLLRALLENLLSNAWKFTGKQPEASIEFTVSAANGRPQGYVVRDNGAGFDMLYASKLFGAFQRLHSDRDFEGTGVGLATAQRIVQRHGGEIWAEGAPGKGASFYFTLAENGT